MKTNYCRVMATMALRYQQQYCDRQRREATTLHLSEYHRLTNRIANMARDTLGCAVAIRRC